MPDYKYRGPTRLYLDYVCSTGTVLAHDGDVVSGLSAVRDVPVPPADGCWEAVTEKSVLKVPPAVIAIEEK